MKKILVSASAIAMMAAASSAYAAEEIEIGITGNWVGGFVFGQQDSDTDNGTAPGANVRSSNFNQISEFAFTGDTTLDSGIEVGVRIEVEGETNGDQIDDSYVWFEHGSYGYLALGGRSGAADVVAMGAPTVVPGAGVADADFIGFTAPSAGSGDLGDFEVEDTIWNDTPAVRYTTPRVAGFALTLGATTSGGSGDRVTGLTEQDSEDGLRGEGFGAGIQYRGDVAGVGVRVGVAYERVLYGIDTDTSVFEDERDLITSGIRLDVGDFRFQGGVSLQTTDFESNTNNGVIAVGTVDEEEKLDIQLGAIYQMDAISFSLEYAYNEITQDNLAANVEDTAEGHLYGAGIAYDMGAGVSIGAGIYAFDMEDEIGVAAASINDSNENSGWYGVVSTSVDF